MSESLLSLPGSVRRQFVLLGLRVNFVSMWAWLSQPEVALAGLLASLITVGQVCFAAITLIRENHSLRDRAWNWLLVCLGTVTVAAAVSLAPASWATIAGFHRHSGPLWLNQLLLSGMSPAISIRMPFRACSRYPIAISSVVFFIGALAAELTLCAHVGEAHETLMYAITGAGLACVTAVVLLVLSTIHRGKGIYLMNDEPWVGWRGVFANCQEVAAEAAQAARWVASQVPWVLSWVRYAFLLAAWALLTLATLLCKKIALDRRLISLRTI